ncbi:MAG TPA: CCA tRNA nucleotidyltransferase [Geminicoccaceae bacterium]|nr:CCA tRNA nucleotidyltransferase [Geminicoccaceae bacterium]
MPAAPDDDRPLAGRPWLTAESSRRVLAALSAGGRPARFVGGCVRDGLLGRDVGAGTDLDLATPEPPERATALLRAAGIRVIPTGLAHGTVTAVVGERRFEVTTLRRDVLTFGRRAEVAFTDDFRADAARRDFTINAMSCDAGGRVYDYFGGREDLARGRVRFVGDARERVAEDYLRILRFFRFLAHYGRGPADPLALAACAAGAPGIDRLSGERIRVELLRLLAAPDPVPSLGLMEETGVLARVIPGGGAAANPTRLARLVALEPPPADGVRRLAALLRPPPAGPGAAPAVAERLRLSNRDRDRLLDLTTAAPPAARADPAAWRRELYRLGPERFVDLALLAWADDPDAPYAAALAAARDWRPVTLPVDGRDVLAQGVPPGPRVGELLRRVEGWWIAADFRPDRAACLARLRNLAGAAALE